MSIYLKQILLCCLMYYVLCDGEGKNVKPLLRITYGIPAKPGEIPYQVSFKRKLNHGVYRSFCGGSIVTHKKVVSAAHCFSETQQLSAAQSECMRRLKKGVYKDYAVAGIQTLSGHPSENNDGSTQWRKIDSITIAKNYAFPANDLAVIIVSKNFFFNAYVNKIPLSVDYSDFTGLCMASGFGRNEFNRAPEILMRGDIRLEPHTNCVPYMAKVQPRYRKSIICAITYGGRGVRVSVGDSGGPLVCYNTGDRNDEGRGVLFGVTSALVESTLGSGTLFTRVSHFADFVDASNEANAIDLYNLRDAFVMIVCLHVLLNDLT